MFKLIKAPEEDSKNLKQRNREKGVKATNNILDSALQHMLARW